MIVYGPRMLRTSLIACLLAFAGCAGHDHVTKADEIVDTWLKDTSAPAASAQSIHFHLDSSFELVTSDGTPIAGMYEVKDPLLLLYPTNPAGTFWCIPKAVDTQTTLVFSVFDPTPCAKAPMQPSTMAPLEGLYNLKPASM